MRLYVHQIVELYRAIEAVLKREDLDRRFSYAVIRTRSAVSPFYALIQAAGRDGFGAKSVYSEFNVFVFQVPLSLFPKTISPEVLAGLEPMIEMIPEPAPPSP